MILPFKCAIAGSPERIFLQLTCRISSRRAALFQLVYAGEQIHVTEYKRPHRKPHSQKLSRIIPRLRPFGVVLMSRNYSWSRLKRRCMKNSVRPSCAQRGNLHKAYGIKVGSFLGFLKHVLALDTLPDYETVVQARLISISRSIATVVIRSVFCARSVRFPQQTHAPNCRPLSTARLHSSVVTQLTASFVLRRLISS